MTTEKTVDTKKITKNMTFAELIEKNPEVVEKLMGMGMHCCQCPMARLETIEQGAAAHGLNPDKVIEELIK